MKQPYMIFIKEFTKWFIDPFIAIWLVLCFENLPIWSFHLCKFEPISVSLLVQISPFPFYVDTAMTHHFQDSSPQWQCPARGLFQLSRRDREYLSFNLVLRDGIENFFLSVSCFETRSRFSFFQSRASRREREFLSFNLVLRDKHENFST